LTDSWTGTGSNRPAPIVPLGASDPPQLFDRLAAAIEPDLEVGRDESASEPEVVVSTEASGPRLLEYLSLFLAAETVLSVFVVVGAFVGLIEDHRGVGPLSQDPYFSYTGFSAAQFVVFVAALLLVSVLCGFGAWTAFRASRPDLTAGNQVQSRTGRVTVVGWLAQAAFLPAAILTFVANSPHGQWGATSPVDFWPNVLTGWAWLALDAVGVLAVCSFCVGLQARRKDLLPKPDVVAIASALLSVGVAVLATLSLSTALNSATGFWSTAAVSGPSAFGTYPEIEGVSCGGDACFALAVASSGHSESMLRVSGKSIDTVSKVHVANAQVDTLTCVSRTVCFATGPRTMLRTANGGKSFAPMDLPTIAFSGPNAVPPFWTLECSAADRCYAFAQFVFAISTDEGLHWRVLLEIPPPEKRGPAHYISSGACQTLSDCFAIGSYGSSSYATYTTDGGLNWELATGAPRGFEPDLGDAQCFSATACYAVAGVTRIVSTDAGRSWSTDTSRWKQGAVCATARNCIAAGLDLSSRSDVIGVTGNGGSSWSTAVKLPVGLEASNVSCGTGGLCSVGFSSFGGSIEPEIAVTTDYGTHWKFLHYT
jgi:hypothetical protein